MSIHYLETGSVDPCYNLALEQYVLEHRREGDWLMLWQNRNTVVVGLNQNTKRGGADHRPLHRAGLPGTGLSGGSGFRQRPQ